MENTLNSPNQKVTSIRTVRTWCVALSCALLFVLANAAEGMTMDELLARKDLTPARFASLFSDFSYKFRTQVQNWDQFLATGSGDCDDYATLACEVLKKQGYTTRLILIQMPGRAHAVCYVEETQCYLDFNNRSYIFRTKKSKAALEDIAATVVKGSGTTWTSVSEATYANGAYKTLASVKNADYKAPAPGTLSYAILASR